MNKVLIPMLLSLFVSTSVFAGEKGGTADINIGVGELQEMTISKSRKSQPTHVPRGPSSLKKKGKDKKAALLVPAVQKVRASVKQDPKPKSNKKGNIEYNWKVEKGEK